MSLRLFQHRTNKGDEQSHTELHRQIEDLRSRVRELEEALAVSHSSHSNTVHELLVSDSVKASGEVYQSGEAEESRLHAEFDALMISDTGAMQ